MTAGTGVSAERAADRGRLRAATAGGLCGLVAGACWIGKGAAVLVTGWQPPVLFEVAPLLMAMAVWGLARQLPPSRGRTLGSAAGALGVAAALPVVVGEVTSVPTAVTGTGMAVAHLAVLAGLTRVGVELRRQRGDVLPLVLAVVTVPAVAAGGALSALAGERALEVPIVALGFCWAVLGVRLLRQTS
ncbi:hypothetical protein [Blastococcus deserti]|uniref:Uncharacterized protein n=1 Tax=Blastococcus deserti TaxID=2259033 RepID=A0ABW4X5Q8_9ACTN